MACAESVSKSGAVSFDLLTTAAEVADAPVQ
jgi:hypothetical protein